MFPVELAGPDSVDFRVPQVVQAKQAGRDSVDIRELPDLLVLQEQSVQDRQDIQVFPVELAGPDSVDFLVPQVVQAKQAGREQQDGQE